MRSRLHTSAGIILLLLAARAAASPALPVAMPLERYTTMIERSPFAVATETAPTPSVAGFARDLVLTGAARLGGGAYLTLSSKDQTQRFALKTGETYNGISVVSISWSEAVGKTKVTLKCGNEFGVVGYDEALLNTPAAPTPPAGHVPYANGTPPSPSPTPQTIQAPTLTP